MGPDIGEPVVCPLDFLRKGNMLVFMVLVDVCRIRQNVLRPQIALKDFAQNEKHQSSENQTNDKPNKIEAKVDGNLSV